MSETTNPSAKAPKSARPKKPKKAANHPKYGEMIIAALNALKERGGSSRQKILKYVMVHYDVGKDSKAVNTHLKLALKRGVTLGILKHPKGSGASGSFRLASAAPIEEVKPKKEKPTKPKSVTVKKVTVTPKKPKAKKPAIKSKATTKKTKAPKKAVPTKAPKLKTPTKVKKSKAAAPKQKKSKSAKKPTKK